MNYKIKKLIAASNQNNAQGLTGSNDPSTKPHQSHTVTVELGNHGKSFAHGSFGQVFLATGIQCPDLFSTLNFSKDNNPNFYVLKRITTETNKNQKTEKPFGSKSTTTIGQFRPSNIKDAHQEYNKIQKLYPELVERFPGIMYGKGTKLNNDSSISKAYLPMEACLPVIDLLRSLKTNENIDHHKFELERYFIIKCLWALHHLHKNNIIHSDIKPENMMTRNGQIYYPDFGLSIELDPQNTTRDLVLMTGGTEFFLDRTLPSFPVECRDGIVRNIPIVDHDHRYVDIYALGLSIQLIFEKIQSIKKFNNDDYGHNYYEQSVINTIHAMLDPNINDRIQLTKDKNHRRIRNLQEGLDMNKIEQIIQEQTSAQLKKTYGECEDFCVNGVSVLQVETLDKNNKTKKIDNYH